jgi:arylformamidase
MPHTRKNAGWIDISVPLHNGMAHWPDDPKFEIELAKSIGRGDVCNVSRVCTSVHIGTHMDAPYHFFKNGIGIDQAPLEAVVGPCRVIPVHDPAAIKPADLVDKNLRPGERVLFKTRNSQRAWKTDAFVQDFVYLSKEAAQFLVDRQVQTVGVDYLSVGGFFKDGLETHQILLSATVWIIEGLDLSAVEPGAYDLICLPIKLQGRDGAPARAILRPL